MTKQELIAMTECRQNERRRIGYFIEANWIYFGFYTMPHSPIAKWQEAIEILKRGELPTGYDGRASIIE